MSREFKYQRSFHIRRQNLDVLLSELKEVSSDLASFEAKWIFEWGVEYFQVVVVGYGYPQTYETSRIAEKALLLKI